MKSVGGAEAENDVKENAGPDKVQEAVDKAKDAFEGAAKAVATAWERKMHLPNGGVCR